MFSLLKKSVNIFRFCGDSRDRKFSETIFKMRECLFLSFLAFIPTNVRPSSLNVWYCPIIDGGYIGVGKVRKHGT